MRRSPEQLPARRASRVATPRNKAFAGKDLRAPELGTMARCAMGSKPLPIASVSKKSFWDSWRHVHDTTCTSSSGVMASKTLRESGRARPNICRPRPRASALPTGHAAPPFYARARTLTCDSTPAPMHRHRLHAPPSPRASLSRPPRAPCRTDGASANTDVLRLTSVLLLEKAEVSHKAPHTLPVIRGAPQCRNMSSLEKYEGIVECGILL